ncbi:MORN repeat-containing protein 3-like [Hetaerina americana]|uniref:MORN repeat-containing protein 3-like n=1 Tax=Hetaerina americana TaxID=62018 RepID=UPI003A7F5DDD
MRHGHGVLSKRKEDHCDKTHYTGGWQLGKRHGQGRQIYEDGTVYIGKWSQGKRDGHGRIWYKNGDFYEGDWCDDKPHGYGIFVYANGCRFEGEWMNGLKHGYGRFYHLLTGQLQDGLWIKDVSKCSGITEIPYRQNAPRPNPYPLHKLELEDSHKVQMSAEEHAITNFLNSLDATINLEEQK